MCQLKVLLYANDCLSLTIIITCSNMPCRGRTSLARAFSSAGQSQAPCLRHLSFERVSISLHASKVESLNFCLTAASGSGGQRRYQLPRWSTLPSGTSEVQPSGCGAFRRNIASSMRLRMWPAVVLNHPRVSPSCSGPNCFQFWLG